MPNASAVFTIVKNEAFFLPRWIAYYEKHFAYSDMVVLDHESTDGSTDHLPCAVERLHHDFAFDVDWLRDTVQHNQQKLLKKYDYVLFVEVDEIIAPDPSMGIDLRSYIASCTNDTVRCKGWNVLHERSKEPTFDPHRGILEQRGFWYESSLYGKALLSRVPLHWDYGFHICNEESTYDPNLWLIHLHRFDYDYSKKKTMERRGYRWRESDIEAGMSYQNRAVGREFDAWFDQRDDAIPAQTGMSAFTRIPDSVRHLI